MTEAKQAVATRQDHSPLTDATPAWMKPENLDQAIAIAEKIGKSGMLPARFDNNSGAVLLAMDYAQRLDVPILILCQKMYEVHGSIGFEYPLLLSLLHRAGYKSEWIDEGAKRQVLHLTRPDGTQCPPMIWDEERAKGYKTYVKGKQSTLWAKWQLEGKDPATMLAARCVSFAIRKYAPEVTCGPTYVPEELEEMKPADVQVREPSTGNAVADLKRDLGVEPDEATKAFVDDTPPDDDVGDGLRIGVIHEVDEAPDSASTWDCWIKPPAKKGGKGSLYQLDESGMWAPASESTKLAVRERMKGAS